MNLQAEQNLNLFGFFCFFGRINWAKLFLGFLVLLYAAVCPPCSLDVCSMNQVAADVSALSFPSSASAQLQHLHWLTALSTPLPQPVT